MRRARAAVAAAVRRVGRWAGATLDITDILTATGILTVAVWVVDLSGWPAAIGFIGVCLLSLGIGSVLISALFVRRR